MKDSLERFIKNKKVASLRVEEWIGNYTKTDICVILGISRPTLDLRLKENNWRIDELKSILKNFPFDMKKTKEVEVVKENGEVVKLKMPKNDHMMVIKYLLTYNVFDLKFVINDSMFFKFQSRLAEIEKKFGNISSRERVPFLNRYGRVSKYNNYSKSVTTDRLLEIYDKYDK